MSSVEEFWAKLKLANAPSKAREPAVAPKAPAAGIKSAADVPAKALGAQQSSAAADRGLQPSAVPQDPDAVKQQLTRDIEGLRSDSAPTRQKAASKLKATVLQLSQNTETWQLPLLQDVLEGSLGKMLLRRFDDAGQGCRELCVTSFLTAFAACPGSVLPLLPYAVPVLEERLCRSTAQVSGPAEACEEVRLELAKVTHTLVRLGGKALSAYASEVVALLESMLSDAYHDINILGCETLIELNACMGLRLSSVSKQLVAATLPLTTHKRHKVRIAAVQAVRVTMHQSAHEMILEMLAWRDPNVVPVAAFYGDDLKVNFAGKLATDPHPAVRLEWVLTLHDWMTNLRERIDHEPRLLPYLLSALTDPVPAVCEAAVTALEGVGRVYEQDHAKELEQVTAYLPIEAQGLGGQHALTGTTPATPVLALEAPSTSGSGQPASAGVSVSAADSNGSTGGAPGTALALRGIRRIPTGLDLPPALTRTWGLGVIRTVQGQASRSLHALTCEMFAWQAESRRSATSLLRTMLALSGDATHQHAQTLVPALCRAMPDPDVRPLALDCMTLLACSLPPGLLLELLLPRLRDGGADTGVQAGIVRLMTALARGAGAGASHDLRGCLPDLCSVLDGPDGCMYTRDSELRHATHEYLGAVIQAAGQACGTQMIRLLVASLHLSTNSNASSPSELSIPDPHTHALAATATPTTSSAAEQPAAASCCLVAQLAAACGLSSVYALVCQCADDMLGACRPELSVNAPLTACVLARLMLILASQQQSQQPDSSSHSSTAATAACAAAGQPISPSTALRRVLRCVQCITPLLTTLFSTSPRTAECVVMCLRDALRSLASAAEHSWDSTVTVSVAPTLCEVLRVSGGRGRVEAVCEAVGVSCEAGWVTHTQLFDRVSKAAGAATGTSEPLLVALSNIAASARAPAGRCAACAAITTTLQSACVSACPAQCVISACEEAGALRTVANSLCDRLADAQVTVQAAAADALAALLAVVRRAQQNGSSGGQGAGGVVSLLQSVGTRLKRVGQTAGWMHVWGREYGS